MPIRWNLILNGSWETSLSQALMKRPLGMAGGFVSIAISSPHYQMKGIAVPIDRPVVFPAGPGLHIAQASLWIACAMSLAVFNIEKYVDESGKVVEPEIRYTGGAIR